MATHLFQLAQNNFSSLVFFGVLNFRGHFEALNGVFWRSRSLHHSKQQSVGSFHYYTPQGDLFNDLSSDPNKDRMQKFHHQEVDIPTYHFGAHKTIGISSSRVLSRVFPFVICVKKTFGLFVLLTCE